jgi:5-methylcytosine-specific restriction enzyme subunit McrC
VERLTLYEYQKSLPVRLTAEQRDSLGTLIPSLAITPARGREGCYELTPGSTIGAVRLPDLAIEVHPKIPIDRVLFLLSYALDPRAWRATSFDFAERHSLLEAVVEAFLRQVRQAFRRGVLQGYRSEEEALPGVRGRIRLDDQLRRRFGIAPPVEVRYDDFTEDIEPNRLILAAASRLERMRLRSEESKASLRWIDSALERVSPQEYDLAHIPEISWNRLNEHYRWAVELARLILRGTMFDLRHGGVRASALLIDMNEVFETFVATALREALRLTPHAFPHGAAGKRLWLDQAQAVRLEPDLSWWDGGRCLFVGDVKYKRIRIHGVKHSDLYQLLAYTIAAGLDGGLLIYAAGEGEPVVHEVVDLGKRLEVTTLDLTGQPEAILRQVQAVAERVRASARLRPTAILATV